MVRNRATGKLRVRSVNLTDGNWKWLDREAKAAGFRSTSAYLRELLEAWRELSQPVKE
jgi:hypothetical protein